MGAGRDRRRFVPALVVVAVLAVVAGAGVLAWLDVRGERDVLLVGDSIMRQTGPALEEALPSHSIDNRGVNGSGLLNPQVYDWVDRLPGVVARARPETTVVLFIGNYAPEDEWWIDAAGDPVPPDTEAFYAEWREQAERIVAILEESGSDIVWVLPPPVSSAAGNRTIAGLRAVYEDLAAAHPSITLVDAAPPLSDDDGAYVGSVVLPDGGVVDLRTGDGVHLAPTGAALIAEEIAAAIR
ncbi:MAG: GDSL-type esterase/lipase family protein [Actinomycetota bacterium]